MDNLGRKLALWMALIASANLAWISSAEGAPQGPAKRLATSADLTAEEIAGYLNKHLELRNQTVPQAANMEYMVSSFPSVGRGCHPLSNPTAGVLMPSDGDAGQRFGMWDEEGFASPHFAFFVHSL